MPHTRRASCTVHSNGWGGVSMRALAQHARRTRASNAALWAARKSTPSRSSATRGHTPAKRGELATSSHESPWTQVNSNHRDGGRIRHASRRTIRPRSTRTTPTAHALSGQRLAVSKSMAANVGAWESTLRTMRAGIARIARSIGRAWARVHRAVEADGPGMAVPAVVSCIEWVKRVLAVDGNAELVWLPL